MVKRITQKEIDQLHDKFIKGTISREEKNTLFNHFAPMFTDKKGKLMVGELEEFLAVTHKDYGKPDKNGIIQEI